MGTRHRYAPFQILVASYCIPSTTAAGVQGQCPISRLARGSSEARVSNACLVLMQVQPKVQGSSRLWGLSSLMGVDGKMFPLFYDLGGELIHKPHHWGPGGVSNPPAMADAIMHS